MGVVWEASDARTCARVALKHLKPSLGRDRESVERLRTEAEIPMLLDHPRIVRVLALGFPPEHDQPFFVMELLRGRTLDLQIRRGGPLPVADALEIAVQALDGLAAAHRAGVVHRDVKLGNLFVCEPGEGSPSVKLIDFGIAKLLGPESAALGLTPHSFRTREGEYLGTTRYAAPEQVSGMPVDPRADIYAMGVVLYTLLAGSHPFGDLQGLELIRAHIGKMPDPPSRNARSPVPPELDELVMTALAKKPEQRLASAEQFASALRDVAERLQAPAGWLKTHWFQFEDLDETPAAEEAPRVAHREPPRRPPRARIEPQPRAAPPRSRIGPVAGLILTATLAALLVLLLSRAWG
jgi:serine/threonine-protein kinase